MQMGESAAASLFASMTASIGAMCEFTSVHKKNNANIVTFGSDVLAFAKWQYPHTLTTKQKAEKEESEKDEEPRPPGMNSELGKIFRNALDERRIKHVDESEVYCKRSCLLS